MDWKGMLLNIAKSARLASHIMATIPTDMKNRALLRMAEGLLEKKSYLLEENRKDVSEANKKNLSKAFIDRLTLNESRIKAMADGLREVASLPDPVGEITRMWRRPNGLLVGRMRIPLGVIGIIYESRPNVTADAAGLCIKSGNAVILRGGSESLCSNIAIGEILKDAMRKEGLPDEALQIIPSPERELIKEMLQLEEYIDLIIPRGGEGLIRFVAENSRIPVIKHYKGVCHIYVDDEADLDIAETVCFNAKVQRPGVCNAMETLLVHESIASIFLPRMIEIFEKASVEIRGCKRTCEIAPHIKEATEQDWYEEYLDLILAVKVVNGIDEAIHHIRKYGSMHTDAIITKNYEKAMKFIKEVNSSLVLVNASTRFNDGYQLGLGAEIGISTSKIHAFGPMGLEELTTTKFIAFGSGQIREN